MLEELAGAAGLRVRADVIPLDRLKAADEVFATSTTFLVMPVVTIDGEAVGGRQGAGPVARDLARRLRGQLGLQG